MEFKLKNKVKLYDNDTVLLRKLLEQAFCSEKGLQDNIAEKMTDEQYHELCHQCYLYKTNTYISDLWRNLFPDDDGEINMGEMEPMEKRKHKWWLIDNLFYFPITWNIYCSTIDALKALEKDNND